MLPVLDGYEVCKRLRMEGNKTPIIMLTVKDKEIDKVLGLELGAQELESALALELGVWELESALALGLGA